MSFASESRMLARETFVERFNRSGLTTPVIHDGWFADLTSEDIPSQVCFAFYDGDVYDSIKSCFALSFDKVSCSGRIVIDDCGWSKLPGVLKAATESLHESQSREKIHLHHYKNPMNGSNSIGLIVRQQPDIEGFSSAEGSITVRSRLIPSFSPPKTVEDLQCILSSRSQAGLESGEPLNQILWKAKDWTVNKRAREIGWTGHNEPMSFLCKHLFDELNNG